MIAQQARLGNITEASLNDSISRFKRFVNSKNKYHVHRILMPDGSKFVYENIQQNAEPTGDSIARKGSRKRLSISSASTDSIHQNETVVNSSAKKYDLADDAAYLSAVKSGDMETAQRMVDEAAIRGEDGKVYHFANIIYCKQKNNFKSS